MALLYGRNWTRPELSRYVADMGQLAGIRPVVYQDGPESGVRALEFRTGAGLSFTVLADRAMDVGLAEIHGVPLSFMTGVGYAHPAYFSARESDWLRTFPGGLFVTCGLDFYGHPVEDQGRKFGLHGPATSLAARSLSWDADWDGDQYVLRARGKMRQISFQGEHLQLTREITARLGENRFAVHDVVENLGNRPEPHMILYHFNAGFPLLDDGAVLELSAGREDGPVGMVDATASAAPPILGPTAGFQDRGVRHDAGPDADGWATARVRNPHFQGGRGLALTIRYQTEHLPYLNQWQNFQERSYVMGVEPCNTARGSRQLNRERGALPMLEIGERREYRLEVEATLGLAVSAP